MMTLKCNIGHGNSELRNGWLGCCHCSTADDPKFGTGARASSILLLLVVDDKITCSTSVSCYVVAMLASLNSLAIV